MINYIVRKLLYSFLIVFGVITIVFFIIRVVPGDPAVAALGEQASEQAIEILREKWGLSLPIWQQYKNYLINLVNGNMGYSYTTNLPVIELIKHALYYTTELAIASLFIAIIIGIPLGITTALKRNSMVDYIGRLISLLGISTPNFYLGILLMLLFSLYLGILPSMGAGSIRQLVLPAIAGGIGIASYLTRITRSSILNIAQELYVTTARSKGLSERLVIYKHIFRNAFVTIITFLGVYIIVVFGGTVIVETVFSRPGLGRLLTASALQRDYMLLQGVVLVYAIFVALVNTMIDIIVAFIDPRIRLL